MTSELHVAAAAESVSQMRDGIPCRIYGVGFTWKEAFDNKDKWGLNVLGKVLMEVREWLREQDGGESPGASHDGGMKKD